MSRIEFRAQEYQADGGFRPARYRFAGSKEEGWSIDREGRPHLELGPGYRLLRTHSCGICSTDLARRFLPFPLPQITGHELVALDEEGRRYAVEINASHLARGVSNGCPFCASGIANHCPERFVLGIHDLPGGFGPWILSPVNAALPIPDEIPTESAVLIEPFAAALNAVRTVVPKDGERIAVLGPRRLGMLVIAALAAWQRLRGRAFEIVALTRRAELAALARELGATDVVEAGKDGSFPESARADVVIDTSGNPEALATAVALARREVHLKSTHGRPSQGLAHMTELVVDELALDAWPGENAEDSQRGFAFRSGFDGAQKPRIAWLARGEPPRWLRERAEIVVAASAAPALAEIERRAKSRVPRAESVVADDAALVDDAIRPLSGSQTSLALPRGTIWIHPAAKTSGTALLAEIVERGLRLSSSRCGDFKAAIDLMAADADLRALGKRLVTHRFTGDSLAEAFETARSPDCLKAVVVHADQR